MKRHQTRLQDVARAAGVSAATASRALSHPDAVRPEKVLAVRDAVTKLGYVPDGAGRALALRQSHTVGAILPTLDHAIFAHTADALQNVLSESGYALLLGCDRFDQNREFELAQTFIGHGVDGLVLVGIEHRLDLLELMERTGVPGVCTWAYGPTSALPCVGYDNGKVGALMVEHLYALGHRDIGVIAGMMLQSERHYRRIQGIRREVARFGLALPEHRLFDGPISYETGRLGVRALLSRPTRPTALLCSNDVIAVGALAECAERGIAVPGDLSVMGCEDLPVATGITPTLTTIRFPAEALGVLAGSTVLQRLAGESVLWEQELEVDLLPRASTAEVPSYTYNSGAITP